MSDSICNLELIGDVFLIRVNYSTILHWASDTTEYLIDQIIKILRRYDSIVLFIRKQNYAYMKYFIIPLELIVIDSYMSEPNDFDIVIENVLPYILKAQYLSYQYDLDTISKDLIEDFNKIVESKDIIHRTY